MLEHLTPAIYDMLQTAPGKCLAEIDVSKQKRGSLIRAVTHSGTRYLFEVIDPENRRVHLVQGEGRPGAARFEYVGNHMLLCRILETGQMMHLPSVEDTVRHTTCIEELVLLD